MEYKTEDLKRKLIENDVLTSDEFDKLLTEAQEAEQDIKDVLQSKNIISSQKLAQIISELLSCDYINLKNMVIDLQVMEVIPEVVARAQKIVAFDRDKDHLKVAMVDPGNKDIINLLKKKTGLEVVAYCASEDDVNNVIKKYSKGVLEELKELTAEKKIRAVKKAEDVSIIRIIDIVLRYAYENKTSDIHIEPLKDKILIRFRIDGILHDIVALPKSLHDLIVSRIKILSNLRTDEHRAAQDGKFQFNINTEDVDVRVSIIPLVTGEKVVLRILSKCNAARSLEKTGLSGKDLEAVKNSIKHPHGMILVTGPTGSGKSTTLYAILTILNKREVNISTIEDPVEYDIEGVNQIQVNPKTNLTFSHGLRSILRQDPNIIMVGEIRDEETAGIAINAALTGHLVLSTLHTNDAATTLPRLIDMKIEPFLIASTINIIIAQRLVRKICKNCAFQKEIVPYALINAISKELFYKYFPYQEKIRLTYGKGCQDCGQSGYSGRIGIFEVLTIDENIKNLIVKKSNASQIQARALQNGMTTMLEDGLRKVVEGITTIEEVLKTTEIEMV